MKLKPVSPKDAVKFDKQTVEKANINALQKGIKTFSEKLDKNTTAKREHSERIEIMSFLKTIDYSDTDFAYEDEGIDLAIKANNKFGVLFETKSSLETKDMISHDNLNVKPMQQVIYYYLQQRTSGNNEIKHIIVTNGYDWYIFDALDFDRLFYRDNKLLKDFKEHQSGAKAGRLTKNFYEEIAKPFIENSDAELRAVYFNLKEHANGKQTELKALYKLLSGKNLLKKKKQIDSNKLNTKFFKELLYIMGLEEQKEGSKKLIREKAKPDEGSLLENLKTRIIAHKVSDNYSDIEKYGSTYKEQIFGISLELILTWINRLLFLKLLEGQLLDYHKNSLNYKFLNFDKINNFGILDTLFFEVLNVPVEKRSENIIKRYPNIPYLNSSLFEPSELEIKVSFITSLKDNLSLPLFSQTVLSNEKVKELPTLDYLLKFFEAYNFASHIEDDIYTEKGELINASVLGLVFEKINGYKEGSFYTPGFITEYMARETIRKAVIQKFNYAYKLDIADFDELRNYTIGNVYKKDKIIEFNKLINSLKIVDPAVGSGHFLVSSLNEILSIKSELGILADGEGNKLACKIKIENDTAVINDTQNKLFRYSLDEENKIIEDKNKIQSGIFHEKKTIIENCLFGVDINPNSVKICRLRLWIELLKNSYYKHEDIQLETLPNIDINIKEGNSLISRFPLNADLSKALKVSKWNLFSYQNAVQTYKNTKDRKVKQELVKLIDEIKSNFTSELRSQNPKLVKLNKLKNKFYDLFSGNMLFEASEEYGGKNTHKDTEKKREVQKRKMESEINKLSEEINEIKISKIYRNALEWRFEFPEVLDDKGNFIGFDVVIGNPPYVSIQSLGHLASEYGKFGFETYTRTGDLYALFYEQGNRVLKNNGLLCFITGSAWMRANYGINLRKFFNKHTAPIQLIDFSDCEIFDSATVLTNIMFFNKGEQNKATKSIRITRKDQSNLEQLREYFVENYVEIEKFPETSWIISDKETFKIKNKVEKQGIKIFDWNISISRGIVTGCNEAFIISTEKRNELIEKEPKCKKIIKPLLRGRDIKKWQFEFNNLWLIYIPWHFPLHEDKSIQGASSKAENEFMLQYEAVYNHLLSYKKKLESRNKVETGIRYEWYTLQRFGSKFWKDFEKPKIIYPNMTKFLPFTLDNGEYYTNQKCFIITGENLEFLTSFFNSKLFRYCFVDNFPELQGNTRELNKVVFEQIPVKQISENEEKPFITKVDEILKLKKENPQADTIALEAEIDKMVYELYELTEEEISIVENN